MSWYKNGKSKAGKLENRKMRDGRNQSNPPGRSTSGNGKSKAPNSKTPKTDKEKPMMLAMLFPFSFRLLCILFYICISPAPPNRQLAVFHFRHRRFSLALRNASIRLSMQIWQFPTSQSSSSRLNGPLPGARARAGFELLSPKTIHFLCLPSSRRLQVPESQADVSPPG